MTSVASAFIFSAPVVGVKWNASVVSYPGIIQFFLFSSVALPGSCKNS
jgi:hypothetical protein